MLSQRDGHHAARCHRICPGGGGRLARPGVPHAMAIDPARMSDLVLDGQHQRSAGMQSAAGQLDQHTLTEPLHGHVPCSLCLQVDRVPPTPAMVSLMASHEAHAHA